MVPLLSGPVPEEVLTAENPMQFMTEKVKAKHPSFRVLEGRYSEEKCIEACPMTRKNAVYMMLMGAVSYICLALWSYLSPLSVALPRLRVKGDRCKPPETAVTLFERANVFRRTEARPTCRFASSNSRHVDNK